MIAQQIDFLRPAERIRSGIAGCIGGIGVTGFPSPATDYAEYSPRVNDYLKIQDSTLYYVASGEDWHPLVLDGSLLVVESGIKPDPHGDLVIARVDDSLRVLCYECR